MGFVCYTNSGFLKKCMNWLFSFMLPILSQTKALDLGIMVIQVETKTVQSSKCLSILLYSFYHIKVSFIKNRFLKSPAFKVISGFASNYKKKKIGNNKSLTRKIYKNQLFNHKCKISF